MTNPKSFADLSRRAEAARDAAFYDEQSRAEAFEIAHEREMDILASRLSVLELYPHATVTEQLVINRILARIASSSLEDSLCQP